MYVSLYIYIYKHTNNKYTNIHICIYIHVYVCVCLFVDSISYLNAYLFDNKIPFKTPAAINFKLWHVNNFANCCVNSIKMQI